MNRPLTLLLASFFLIIILFVVAITIPNTLPVGSDFSALYYADLAFVNGIPIYDIPAMEALALEASGIPAENFFMPRFPYPPWYVLSTFYLGLLPIESAGTLWFELNLLMLFLSIWLLTDGWDGKLRLMAFPLGLLFLPVIGALSVGQFDFPVLLGASMLIYSLRKEHVPLTILGAVLLTFKPHVGALILLSVLGWLIGNRSNFGRRALRSVILAGVFLFAIGFLAEPAWIVNYPTMLLNYQDEGNVTACSECANIPVFTSRWLFDGSLSRAALIAILMLVVLTAIFFTARKKLFQAPELLVTSALLITLLASPYLYNYDFILLLVPFAALATGNLVQKIVVLVCHLVPTFALAFYGRAGNITLLFAALLLAFFVFQRARSQVDVNQLASYNTAT
jgi:glycosyl transferase family 87